MTFCSKCGSKINLDSSFCKNCDNKIKSETEAKKANTNFLFKKVGWKTIGITTAFLIIIFFILMIGCTQQQTTTSEPIKNEPKCQLKDMQIGGYSQADVCVDSTGIYPTENYCEAKGDNEGYVIKKYFCQNDRCVSDGGTWTRCGRCGKISDLGGFTCVPR